ncbi:CarD family transcriptional regulator [Mitsuokella sp. oral taxon 131]|uniref:CarD family transcriptional regulator n=1 Tax=Mitsuokella sp. oral taxon 131 TaxID=1321780 RepID=UPI0004120887|nr:CarD family transcriptional regulator [Mitsuokella sp. oral taxon 131]
MLQTGDRVVYPMHGAGVVAGVEECEVLGEKRSYYVIHMPMGNMKMMVPTDSVEAIGIRNIIPVEKVGAVQKVLEDKPYRITGSWNKRFHANLERMKNGDICSVAAVARDLILQDRKRRVSSGERRLLDLSMQILVSELVYACDKEPKDVEQWIGRVLDTNKFA